MARRTRSAPSVVSLFSGVGGIDYGLEAAGFDTRVCVDLDHDSCETIRRNRPSWHVIERDLGDVTSEELLGVAGLSVGELDLLTGGPPCQPFSKAGYWANGDSARLADPRAATLREFMRVWEEVLPRVVLFENVRGFAYQSKTEALDFIRERVRGDQQQHRVRLQPPPSRTPGGRLRCPAAARALLCCRFERSLKL